jgi:hypothetical protein
LRRTVTEQYCAYPPNKKGLLAVQILRWKVGGPLTQAESAKVDAPQISPCSAIANSKAIGRGLLCDKGERGDLRFYRDRIVTKTGGSLEVGVPDGI